MKIDNLVIAYIGGGSRGWAWTLMADLASEPSLSGTVRLYDIDFAAAGINEQIGNKVVQNPDAPGKWKYKAFSTLAETLDGADIVISSILPGTFSEMNVDVHSGEKYGVWQSVGDTTGPGGIMRALRTIPMYVDIANAVKKWCPTAWVINYTNPMALCVRTLYETFPAIKAFGCCHEVFGTQKLLTQAIAEILGVDGVAREAIQVNVLGVNHFTWLDAASWQNIDLFPVYAKFVDKYFESGWEKGKEEHWMNSTFASAERVKFDLFRRYGLIAAAGDRHLAEFMPPWYLANPETIQSWKFSLTPVSWRVENVAKLKKKAELLASGKETFPLKKSGEEGVRQIRALCGLGNMVTNVNLPNRGQIEGLPLGAVVETHAAFSFDAVMPVFAGRLSPLVEPLVARHAYAQETVLRAGLEKDRSLALSAFLNDPLMAIGRSDTEKLLDEMLSATASYLKGW